MIPNFLYTESETILKTEKFRNREVSKQKRHTLLPINNFLSSGGVSGGHLNPAVTLAMAAIKKLKPIQIPVGFQEQNSKMSKY